MPSDISNQKYQYNGGLDFAKTSRFAQQMNSQPLSLSERVYKILGRGEPSTSTDPLTSTPTTKRSPYSSSAIPSSSLLTPFRAFERIVDSTSSSTVADSLFDADTEEDVDDFMQIDDDTPSLLAPGDGTTLDPDTSFNGVFTLSFASHTRAFACNGTVSTPSRPGRALFGLGFSGMFNANLSDGMMSSELLNNNNPFAMDVVGGKVDDMDISLDLGRLNLDKDIEMQDMDISEAYSHVESWSIPRLLLDEDEEWSRKSVVPNAPRIPQEPFQFTTTTAPLTANDIFFSSSNIDEGGSSNLFNNTHSASSSTTNVNSLPSPGPSPCLFRAPLWLDTRSMSRIQQQQKRTTGVTGSTISSVLKRKPKRKPVGEVYGKDLPKWKL